MLRARPDLQIVPFRGNVDTRLRKLAEGVADATLLAVAGLNRLGRQSEITAYLDPERVPAGPGAGRHRPRNPRRRRAHRRTDQAA